MDSRTWSNRLRCLNCGCTVHWTTFRCDVCGQNPRERESIAGEGESDPSPELRIVERRKYPRYNFQTKAILNRSFKGELVDLCQQGARLKTNLRLFRNELIHLGFAINGIPIEVLARVVHVNRGVLDERSTLGVCFETIPEGQKEFLKEHLKAIRPEPPSLQYPLA